MLQVWQKRNKPMVLDQLPNHIVQGNSHVGTLTDTLSTTKAKEKQVAVFAFLMYQHSLGLVYLFCVSRFPTVCFDCIQHPPHKVL